MDIQGQNLRIGFVFRKCWFVGEVYAYFSHKKNSEESFLAAVNVMKSHSIDIFGIPQVKRDSQSLHVAVINVEDIIRCVGLIRFSNDENVFKVTWPYAKYDDRIGNRLSGTLTDLRHV